MQTVFPRAGLQDWVVLLRSEHAARRTDQDVRPVRAEPLHEIGVAAVGADHDANLPMRCREDPRRFPRFVADRLVSQFLFAVFPDEETSQILNNLDSFGKFRQELKASEPEVPPKADSLTLVASAFDWF